MKDGCVYCGGSGMIDTCMLRMRISSNGDYYIRCKGSLNEKKKCPEWGAALAAEEYYKNKLKKGENK
jgi:hypothetical protein